MTSRKRNELVEPSAMAARLRALRKTTGLSQQSFAESHGLGYKQWGNFETGSRIGLDAALVLVDKLSVTLDWVYLGETSMMPNKLMREIEKAMEAPQPSPVTESA